METINNIDPSDRAVKVAEEFIAQQEAAKKAEAESKLTEEQKKSLAEEAKKKAEQEAILKQEELKKQQEEEALLEKEENLLTEDEKKKKEEILKKEESLPNNQKILKGLKDALKRIDKLTGKNKELEFNLKKAIEDKERKIAELENKIKSIYEPKDDINLILDKQEEERIAKYLEEDVKKPREQRREMSKDELEIWFAEDPVEAQRWMIRQDKRRDFERNENLKKIKESSVAEEFLQKQAQSVSRLISKYPNSRPDARIMELKGQGLSEKEIVKKLESEFEEYKIVNDLVNENPNLLERIDFGDFVISELEKRLKPKDQKSDNKNKPFYTEEEVQKAVQEALDAEKKRQASVDEGVRSNMNRNENNDGLKLTAEEEALKVEVEKANARGSKLDFNKVLERHRLRAKNPEMRVGSIGKMS